MAINYEEKFRVRWFNDLQPVVSDYKDTKLFDSYDEAVERGKELDYNFFQIDKIYVRDL